jgi:hypothetical protein
MQKQDEATDYLFTSFAMLIILILAGATTRSLILGPKALK